MVLPTVLPESMDTAQVMGTMAAAGTAATAAKVATKVAEPELTDD